MKYRSVLFIVLISLMLTACTFQEEQARQTIAEESFPDLVLNSGFYQIAQGDNEMITVEAAPHRDNKKERSCSVHRCLVHFSRIVRENSCSREMHTSSE